MLQQGIVSLCFVGLMLASNLALVYLRELLQLVL